MGIIDDIFSSSNPAKYKAGSYANPGQPSPQQGGGLLDYFDEPGRMQTISSALMGAGQGMLQAPQNGGSFGQAMSGLAGMAGGMAQNKKKVEQEAMFEQLAGGDPLKLAFLKSNPEAGMKMMMEQKFAKPAKKDFVSVYNIKTKRLENVENSQIDPRIHMPSSAAPKPKKVGSDAQKAVDAGYSPGTPEFTEYVRELQAKPGQIINFHKGGGGMEAIAAAAIGEAHKKAGIAAQDMFRLDELNTMLASGVPTGRLEESTLGVKNVLASFGVSNPNLSIQEALSSAGNQMALAQHGPGMGPLTEADFQVYKQIVPGLKNTPLGNALIMKRLRRESAGKQLYAEVLQDQYARTGKYSPGNAWKEVAKRLDQQMGPLIPTVTQEELAANKSVYIGQVIMIDGQPKYVKRIGAR